MLLGSVTFQTFRLAKGESKRSSRENKTDKVGRVRQTLNIDNYEGNYETRERIRFRFKAAKREREKERDIRESSNTEKESVG